jgi:hypothetical protein
MSAAQLLIKTDKSDKDKVKIIFSIYVKAHDNTKKQHEAKILFTNQRPPAELGPGPFEGPIPPALLVVADLIAAAGLCLLSSDLRLQSLLSERAVGVHTLLAVLTKAPVT